MAVMVMATAYGGPDVLSLVEDAVAEPGRGEVTIQVKAAGVNPFDHLLYSGAFGADEDSLPFRVGQELSGVVTAAGPEAIGLAGPIQIGDEVIAYRPDILGAYATEVTCPANIVAPKPAALGWERASGLLFAGAAAVHALAATGVKAGDTVLIHGVSGGVGGATDAGTDVRAQAWSELVPLAADGKVVVVIAKTFALVDAAAAHEFIGNGHAGGKVVLVP